MGMAGVGNAVAVCPRVASCSSTYPCRVSKKLDSAFRPCGVSESLRLVLSVLVTRQRIPIQRRTLNTDPGPCGSGPDVQCAVPYGNPGSGVSGSPSGSGGSEADACFGASGGDAGGSRCRAAGCAGLIGFPRPEDETVGQVGGAVGAVAQRPPRGDGACGAGPHADEARRDGFFKPVQELRECHQRTPQRPTKLGTVSLSLSLSHGYFLLQFHDEAQGVVGRQGAHGLCRECVGVPAVGDGVPMRGGRDRVRMAVVGDAVAVLG